MNQERQLADALRHAWTLARGGDTKALLPFAILKDSEQTQWLDIAAAAQFYGIEKKA